MFRVPRSALRVLLLLLLAGRAQAQADPSGSWRTLHTPHFRIHFRPAYRETALIEAREAERSYALLVTELHPPRGVVDITLADDIDAANGFTTVWPTSRIAIYAAPPAGDHGLLFFDDWLRLVTTHELVHVFHLDRSKGIWGGLQRVFGRVPGLFPNEYQPSWVTEGLATYYESKFTNAGRVRGSFHTQLLAADHVAGASRSPWNATLYTRWPDGLVPYAYGSRFLHYLAGVAGDSVVPRLVEATSAQLIPFRVGRQVARVAPGRTLAAEWPLGTGPAPVSVAAPPAARALDSLLRTMPAPRVSPDGRRVAYVRDDGKGASELRVLDVATLRPVAAHRVNGGVDYDWLGDTLLVVQLDFTSRWRIRSDLYRWVPGGAGTWRRATHGARLVAPAGGGGRVAAIALGAGSARPTVPAPDVPTGAVWEDVVPSRDGRWVAGSRVAGGRRALVLWPADSVAAAAVLLETRGSLADVVWTADGDLWFVADPTGFPQVYRWTDDAAEPITAEPLGARAPAPLGDGTLLYAALTARGWELRRATALTGGTAVPFAGPLPFDPARDVPLSETGYTMWPSLLPRFWIPLFLDAGPSGRFFGAVTAGADALGRFQYVAEGFLASHPFRAAGDAVLVSDALGNPRLDLAASSFWLDLLPPPAAGNPILSELDQDASVGVTFVSRRWRRAASLRLAAEWQGTRFAAIPDTALPAACPGCVPQDLVGGSATVALSRVVRGPLSISPEDGFFWSAMFRRLEEQGSVRWSNELRGRLDLYAHVPGLGGFAHPVLALRLAAGALSGPLGAQYKIGGVSSGVVGVTLGQALGGSRNFPVRGYRFGELSGTRAATASVEYRAPLALVGRALGHLPVGADKLWLNLFADAGDAWAPGASPRLTRLRSAGLELAGDLSVSYDFLLGVRLGVAAPLADLPSGAPRRPRAYVALASDF